MFEILTNTQTIERYVLLNFSLSNCHNSQITSYIIQQDRRRKHLHKIYVTNEKKKNQNQIKTFSILQNDIRSTETSLVLFQ